MPKQQTRAALYARVSTHDQQTLPMQIKAMKKYAKDRDAKIVLEYTEVGSGAKIRPQREALLAQARRREIDIIIVWKLDRFGRSLADLVTTLNELRELNIGFISITEALDFTTSSGRAMAGMLSVFAEFEREIIRERVKAGIANAREKGKPHGRPQTAAKKIDEVKKLKKEGHSNAEIARRLKIGRTSVIRLLK